MGRNDLCFCGSGKKVKKCHDFNEKSQAADCLKLYNDLAIAVELHYSQSDINPMCVEGCSDCCYDNFTITDIEFDLILLEIRNWSDERLANLKIKVLEDWDKFKREYPFQAENYEKDGTGNEEIVMRDIRHMAAKLETPCVFLSGEGSCEVYNFRPYLCRRHGVAMTLNTDGTVPPHKICNVIGDSVKASEWQVEVEEQEEKYVRLNVILDNKRKVSINRRKYPVLYFLYMSFFKYERGTSIKNYDDKFSIPKEIYDTEVLNSVIR